MRKLLILGRGQYSYVAEEIAKETFDKIDFLDDNARDAVGKISEYCNLVNDYEYAIVAIGNPTVRLNLTEHLEKAGYKIATLISQRAYVSSSATVEKGCIVEPMAVINPNTVIERCCIISAGVVVNHNSMVGEGCHIDCNATVVSNSTVSSKTKIIQKS